MRSIFLIISLVLGLAACNLLPRDPAPVIKPTPATTPSGQAAIEMAVVPELTSTQQVLSPTPIPSATVSTSDTLPTDEAAIASTPDTGEVARAATARELIDIVPPLRDDVRLAVAYRGADSVMATPQPVGDLQLGMTESFYIGNVDSNTVSQIEAELMSIGENAYFWFDLGDGSVKPDAAELASVTKTFDSIYDTLFSYFGVSEPAGGRVHIVHASPEALCDRVDQCRLAGYFSSRDLLPRTINPQSNERAMFVMNTQQFDSATYLDVLSHELRHMLGEGYDNGDEDWFVEGAAMLAEDLAGFSTLPQARGNLFLESPDQQLNSWTNENTIPHYGQGYLVNRFLYDHLGEALYREFTLSPAAGLSALDAVAEANGLAVTGDRLWLDWLASMALLDSPGVPEEYRWDGPALEPVLTTPVKSLPARFDTTVSQYAADYYELPSSGAVTIDFSGAPVVSLVGADASAGEQFWYAQRANYSNPRLTRSIDLRDADEATLHYRVFADIEYGYDFAYVSVSTDGGQTWQALEAEGMQGLDSADDPSGSALANRYYTGRTGKWIDEAIDLTPFAGQDVLLRFEYVTDPILTYGGFALDDIVIPEIGFLDDGQTVAAGWTAEGFTRATAQLRQDWQLQLITFDAGERPTVERLPVPEDGRLQHTYQAVAGVRRPLLIVAALAPETLEQGNYTLTVNSE